MENIIKGWGKLLSEGLQNLLNASPNMTLMKPRRMRL